MKRKCLVVLVHVVVCFVVLLFRDFEPVSIKMAKDQNLSLNPAKISGLCGRLMCCLKYENDEYEGSKGTTS